jgi:hypothetical protein
VEKPKTEKQIEGLKKKALMEKLMKSREWFSSFVATLKSANCRFGESNENTVINFPT